MLLHERKEGRGREGGGRRSRGRAKNRGLPFQSRAHFFVIVAQNEKRAGYVDALPTSLARFEKFLGNKQWLVGDNV